ncbi:MAG: flippase [Candidatus ainarchaeum sp.]|nr:flippase [Candidatus ainarchaeum sp.]
MQADLNLIVKGAALMTMGVFASKILGYFFNIFLARILAPEELGLFFIATAVSGLFVMFANMGIADSLARFVAFYNEKKDAGRVKGSILSTLRIHIVSSIVVGIALFFMSDWIATAFFSKPGLGLLLKILAITVPVSTIASDFMMATDGFKKIQYKIYIRRIIQIVFKLGLLIALYSIGLSLVGAVLALVFSEAIALVFGWFFLEKKVFSLRSGIKTIFVDRELLGFSMPLLLMGIFSYLLTVFDVILLGFFAPAYSTGVYGTAVDTAKIGLMPLEILVVLGVPIATSYFALNKFHEFKKIYNTLARWILSIVLPLAAIMVLFSEPIQVFLFGKPYANSAIAMSILVLGYLFYAMTGPAQQVLIASGRTKLSFYNATIAGILAVALNIILIPLFMKTGQAYIGAAISTAVSYTTWGALGIIELYWMFKIQPFTKTYFKAAIAGLVGVGISFFLATLPLSRAAINAAISGAAGFFGGILPIMGRLIIAAAETGIATGIVAGLVFIPIYALLFLGLRCFEKEDLQVLAAIERKTGIRINWLRNFVKRFVR